MELDISSAGEPETVRSAFAHSPVLIAGYEGPDALMTAVNFAARAAIGRAQGLGESMSDIMPELLPQGVPEMLHRVYATGEPFTGKEWRINFVHDGGEARTAFMDLYFTPWFHADGTLRGVLTAGVDVTEQVLARQAAEARNREIESAYRWARSTAIALQEALLPADLPLVPGVQVAARYLLADTDSPAGGDWFDALPLPDGRLALTVGDVVGHGVRAAATMGQLRTVVRERLLSGLGPAEVLATVDRFARRTPGAGAATASIAVLDPATGHVRYGAAGHPPALVVGDDRPGRFLPPTGDPPLATGTRTYRESVTDLARGEVLLLYTDGIVERPGLTPEQGHRELRRAAGDAVANRLFPDQAPVQAVERVCRQSLEVLTRHSGHSDDITLLAAQCAPEPPDVEIALPAEVDSVRTVQFELGQWLVALDVTQEDESALQHAVVELVTNVVEHAYRGARGDGRPRDGVLVRAGLTGDGQARVEVADRGCWREPDPAEPHRGNGLSMAGHFCDRMTVDRRETGTTVTVHRTLRRAVRVDHLPDGRRPRPSGGLRVEESPDVPSLLVVTGVVDAVTADRFGAALGRAGRFGTRPLGVDLSGLSHLASSGVQVLHRLHALAGRQGGTLTLYAPEGGVAHSVLALAGLPHTTRRPRPAAGDVSGD